MDNSKIGSLNLNLQKPNIFSLSKDQVKEHYRKAYQEQHWLQQEYNRDYLFIDLEEYYLKLREQILQLLLEKNIISHQIQLEELHLHLSDHWKTYDNDGISKIGTLFYETNAIFRSVLHQFIHHILYKKIIKEPFYFQSTPTFRIHCPNSTNTEFFPHFHTDLALGHTPNEINLWIPLTERRNSHGFYLASLASSKTITNFIDYDLGSVMDESVFKNKDYLALCQPKLEEVKIDAGQALIFDGRCFHTAMPISDHTRISIDFRIVLQKDFAQADFIYENRGRRQLYLLPDEYYFTHTADKLVN